VPTRVDTFEVITFLCAAQIVYLAVRSGLRGRATDDGSRIGAADTRWFEMSNDMLAEASLDGYFTRLSDEWERCLGWTREELMSRPFRDYVHPDDLADTMRLAVALDAGPGEVVNFENRYATKDGSWRWLQWTARSDKHRKYAVARDVTDRKQLEREREDLLGQVQAMARTDALTGLPNRRCWDEELRAAVARARRDGRALTLAMVDLDHFKRYNDARGHIAGDELLVEAAARWRLALRATDFLARYGGEEFALLLPDCAPDEAMVLVERLRAATPSSQTCSVGIACWDRGDSPEDLLTRADAALYVAKRDGRNRAVEAATPAA
jgi:diguanylate cyclase (GGDEF)-like protein/PAS domain S-box-containing protein